MTDALRRLLDALDAVSEEHGEIGDTVVREQMFDTVYAHVVQPHLGAEREVPASFGMFSDAANAAVRAALVAFLADPEVVAVRESATAQQRLDAFQNPEVASASGTVYDDYFGHLDALPS
ncbi:MAG: hypothetical protein AAF845_03595 [Bacteroidota bacterium]